MSGVQGASARLVSFVAGDDGPWEIVGITAVVGEPLAQAARLVVQDRQSTASPILPPSVARWMLRGVVSNERYLERDEKRRLLAGQPALGRSNATYAALIPIRKNDAWWGLSQDERRAIFETRSQHIRIGTKFLPAIARRLHHCRDLATVEPFDFLTWFEYAPADEPAFDRMLAELRATEEWRYVEREVDIRLRRGGKP